MLIRDMTYDPDFFIRVKSESSSVTSEKKNYSFPHIHPFPSKKYENLTIQ